MKKSIPYSLGKASSIFFIASYFLLFIVTSYYLFSVGYNEKFSTREHLAVSSSIFQILFFIKYIFKDIITISNKYKYSLEDLFSNCIPSIVFLLCINWLFDVFNT